MSRPKKGKLSSAHPNSMYELWDEPASDNFYGAGEDDDEDTSPLDYFGAGEQANHLLVAVIVLLIALVVYLFVFYKGGCTGGKAAPAPAAPMPPTPSPRHHPGDGHSAVTHAAQAQHRSADAVKKSFTSQAPLDDSCAPPPSVAVPTEHLEHKRKRAHFSPGVEKIKGPSRRREFDSETTGATAGCGSDMSDLAGYTN